MRVQLTEPPLWLRKMIIVTREGLARRQLALPRRGYRPCTVMSTCHRWPEECGQRGKTMWGGARGKELAGRPREGSEGSTQSQTALSGTSHSYQPAPPPPLLAFTRHLA
ncbi:hypothetical protein E2C01_014119 [Portunus trituberculatus]|uniref:Uncharacterized protein n=1 Tax=Portunus trituberculatus TaxID=210409 RepID=A0A5B7DJ55_PORTR|nr:hypothetical protein [Portunus trituberculatus]